MHDASLSRSRPTKPTQLAMASLKIAVHWDQFLREAWEETIPEAPRLARRAIRVAHKNLITRPNLIPPIEVTVFLTGDQEQRRLNKKFRGKNKSTNVLSFPLNISLPGRTHLGDLSLALETIKAEAKAQKKTPADHFCHLIIHGFLHLLGFDHEKDKDAEEMEKTEIELLEYLKIGNPYLMGRKAWRS